MLVRNKIFKAALVVLLGTINCFVLIATVQAENEKFSARVATLGNMKAAIVPQRSVAPSVVVFPLEIPGKSEISLIANTEYRDLIPALGKVLQSAQTRFLGLFKEIPAFKTNVRLMDEAGFYRRTGAPSWTNAMYYHGEIIIPVPGQPDIENIQRSLRHEFSHAVIHALSNGKCPGWLDEGFAQWAEGAENPGLRPALHNWLSSNQPVPIVALQTGFTRLNPDMVPAAYAQSLFATNLVTQTYGFEAMAHYLRNLRNDITPKEAFSKAFGLAEPEFEKYLHTRLSHWHADHRPKNSN